MRKLLPLFVAFAAACGGSSSKNNPSGPVSGTIGGKAFTPADQEALVAGTGSTPCPLQLGTTTVNVGVKAFAIEFSSYAGACTDLESAQCRVHASQETVMLVFARLNPAGTEPTINPGTYTIASSITSAAPDGTGMLVTAFAQALATTGTCPTPGGTPRPSVQGGSLRIDSVAGPITGHVSVSFQDGSTLAGDFSAPICTGTSVDVCSLATTQALCAPPPTCVPEPAPATTRGGRPRSTPAAAPSGRRGRRRC